MSALQNLLTDVEAARAMRMTTARLVRLARAGELPCVDLGDGDLRFDADDLAAWVSEHKHEGAAMFGFGSKGFDKTQWLADQELVASKDQTKKELRKLTGERDKIEERVKAGELTRAAFNAVDEKIAAVRRKLHDIQKLEIEMPGRCPDNKLKHQQQQLRRRKQEALRRQTELKHTADDLTQRYNRMQREYDEHAESWPPHEREKLQGDLEHLGADKDYAVGEYDKQFKLCRDIEAELDALKEKMIQAKA